MNKNRWLVPVIVLLILFFLGQYISRIFFAIGETGELKTRVLYQGWGVRLFPLDYYALTEAGFSLLQAGIQDRDKGEISRSISLLRRSVSLNSIYYPSHLYLAKALLALDYPQTDHFEEAVSELKTAARIRPGSLDVVLDTTKVLLSLWSYLPEDDKKICQELLMRNAARFSWQDFEPVMETWWLFCKDEGLLVSMARQNPGLHFPMSQKLLAFKMPLILRWELLASHEYNLWQRCLEEYQIIAMYSQRPLSEKKEIFDRLQRIKGYERLLSQSELQLDWTQVNDLRKKVIMEMLKTLIPPDEREMTDTSRREAESFIMQFIGMSPSIDELRELRDLLERRHFFRKDDLSSLNVETLIAYRSNAYWQVITDVEGLRKSISLVRKEILPDYCRLMLTLTDAYISSRLLSQAAETLRELQPLCPENPEIYWRWYKVEAVLGPEISQGNDIQKGKEFVQQSRLLKVDSTDVEHTVYLLDQAEVEIYLGDRLKKQLVKYKLFQVFLNDRIVFEFYTDEIPEKVIIPSAMLGENRIFRVRIRLIQS